MTLHTDPALAIRRKPLKPLLALVLSGEPWTTALQDIPPPPPVSAACVVSYISRRRSDWDRLPPDQLAAALHQAVATDRRSHLQGEWPFLDALETILPGLDWRGLEQLLDPYRQALQG